MRRQSFLGCCIAVLLAPLGLATTAHAKGIVAPAQITSVKPMQPVGDYRICTGGTDGAYFIKGSAMQGIVSNIGKVKAQAYPGGATLGCLYKLGEGEVQSAILQLDGLAWLAQTNSPLLATLGIAGSVLDEEWLTFCNRASVGEENFAGVGQDTGRSIVLAGPATSGINLSLNVLAGYDKAYDKATYSYADNLDAAVRQVSDGLAHCAITILDSTAPALGRLDIDYGQKVRLIRTWDRAFRKFRYPGGQVYRWRYLPQDNQLLQRMLDWKGTAGKASWAPDTIVQPALLVYRNDVTPPELATAMRTAVTAVATLKTDLQD